jgi:hypothetical protein
VPALLSVVAAEPEVENAESAALWVASASTASNHSTPVTSRTSCARQLAWWGAAALAGADLLASRR